MSLVRLLTVLGGMLLLAQSGRAEQTARKFEQTVTITRALDYLLSVPDDYDPQAEALPLVLFLHGAGERGSDLEQVKVHGPPKMVAAGHRFPAIVVSPQCPAESSWTAHIESLIGLIDEIESNYHIDTSRVYVTGLSMGGYGSWRLVGLYPDRFAAMIPICGGGQRFDASRIGDAGIPVWAFHGDHDEGVPLSEAVDLVYQVNSKKNGRARLTVYPETGHDSWTRTYDDPAVWQWLFDQHRSPAETGVESD